MENVAKFVILFFAGVALGYVFGAWVFPLAIAIGLIDELRGMPS